MWWPFSNIYNGFVLILTATKNLLDRSTDGCYSVLKSIADSLDKLTYGCLLSLAVLTRRLDLSVFLLTNAILVLAAGMTLTPLSNLSQFPPVLRFIVWTMCASLCFSMVFTYLQQQYFPEGTLLYNRAI